MLSRLVVVLPMLAACTAHEGERLELHERSAPEVASESAEPSLEGLTMIAPGVNHTCALAGERVLCWGLNRHDILGVGPGLPDAVTEPRAVVGLDEPIVQVASNFDFSCALGQSGALYCWGDNGHGELGVGDLDRRTRPTRVADLRASSVALGFRHGCAVAHDRRTAWCWGSGELGDGRGREFESQPIEIAALAGIDQLVNNGDHACWLRDGEMRCWGHNDVGQIGNGESGCVDDQPRCDCRLTNAGCKHVEQPTEPLVRAPLVKIAAGGKLSYALDRDGRVWQWGRVGDGTQFVDRPQPVVELPVVVQIAAGSQHACALDLDGRIWCWGDNSFAQLGLESREGHGDQHPSPQRVEDLPPARAIAAGLDFTCALTGEGPRTRAWCWGDNDSGQLGDGSTEPRHAPTLVRAAVD